MNFAATLRCFWHMWSSSTSIWKKRRRCLGDCQMEAGSLPRGAQALTTASSGPPSLHPWCVLDEKDVIAEEQQVLAQIGDTDSGDDLAVCFGGGGVRSSAFCCGVLWALAEARRLKDVTHLSSVSGGSIAATSYASFLVQRCREDEPGEDVDQWYHEVVADIILRCQQNAGYLFSWSNNCPQATEDSSRMSRQLDGLLIALVLLGVLVAAPVIFAVYYIVPLSLLLEAYFGGVLRKVFCQQRGVQVLHVIESAPRVLVGIGISVVFLVVLALTRVSFGITPGHRCFLLWRSLIQLCLRWGFTLCFVLGTLVLVHVGQELDYGGCRDVQTWCDAYLQNSAGLLHCSSLHADNVTLPNLSLVHAARLSDALSAYEALAVAQPLLQGLASNTFAVGVSTANRNSLDSGPSSEHGAEGRNKYERSRAAPAKPVSFARRWQERFMQWGFFMTLLLGTAVGCLVAGSLLLLGHSFLWYLVLVVLLPLWFLWPASFVLQWRAFGPVTGQALGFTPLGEAVGSYSNASWNYFVNGCISSAIILLPVFNVSHRFVHHYFRISLQRSFYHHGKDVAMSEVAQCSRVPVLLFGATLNEFQQPGDQGAHSLFVLTQRRMGCERTRFAPAPPWLTLSTCMALSSAAIDAMVLTTVNTWHTRLLLALLNLTQGDWLRFDIGQNWHSFCPDHLQRNLLLANAIDRVPEVLLWVTIYICLLLTNAHALVKMDSAGPGACKPFQWYRDVALAIFAVFIGVLSFFCYVRSFSWLHASPLVRQIHMFFMSHMASRTPPMYLYLTDGGPVEDLGLVVLLRRRQRWILSIDVGDDPGTKLLDLRRAIALAREERICSFFDPADPRRDFNSLLENYAKGKEPFVRFGVLYNNCAGEAEEVGEIFHVRMRLLEGEQDNVPVAPVIGAEEVEPGRGQADFVEDHEGRPGSFELRTLANDFHEDCKDGCHEEVFNRKSTDQAPVVDPASPAVTPQLNRSRSSRSSHLTDLVTAWQLQAMENCSDARATLAPPPIPRHRLGGLCCDCCHRWACGSFPNTHTINQFFTPVMWANFCRLGRELAAPAVQALTAAQRAAKQCPSTTASSSSEPATRRRRSS